MIAIPGTVEIQKRQSASTGIFRMCTSPEGSAESSSPVQLGDMGDRLLDEGDTGEGERETFPCPCLEVGSR